MKKAILILSVLILGCSKHPKLKSYEQQINYIGITDSNSFPPFIRLGLHYYNDTQAYSISVKTCYTDIIQNRETHPGLGIASSAIKNESGVDLKKILSHKVTDSIDKFWQSYYSVSLK
jgi:hypothetical protein